MIRSTSARTPAGLSRNAQWPLSGKTVTPSALAIRSAL